MVEIIKPSFNCINYEYVFYKVVALYHDFYMQRYLVENFTTLEIHFS